MKSQPQQAVSTVPADSRLRRSERIALLLAAGWSFGLLIAALTAPVYGTATGSDTESATGTATLVAVNGPGVLGVVAVPFLVTVCVGLLLARRAGRTGAGPLAWILVGALAGLCVLALLSIGVFGAPVVICLAVACLLHKPA